MEVGSIGLLALGRFWFESPVQQQFYEQRSSQAMTGLVPTYDVRRQGLPAVSMAAGGR